MNLNAQIFRLLAVLALAPAAAFCAASSLGRSVPLNRLVTPNGDHLNDTFIFRCYNPKDSAIEARIFNAAGAEVGKMTLKQRSTAASLTPYAYGEYYDLEWNPNTAGKAPGGVYVYQIRLETAVYKGTVAVIR
ncbi:MAG: hypothetical protein A2X31_13705 [Elusimicrobia bacterium GWB2_63_22]|nr:MAG: hypothetical protein A2X31_13705 [Elusimicrobia bacterium GWB2_63_22]